MTPMVHIALATMRGTMFLSSAGGRWRLYNSDATDAPLSVISNEPVALLFALEDALAHPDPATMAIVVLHKHCPAYDARLLGAKSPSGVTAEDGPLLRSRDEAAHFRHLLWLMLQRAGGSVVLTRSALAQMTCDAELVQTQNADGSIELYAKGAQ